MNPPNRPTLSLHIPAPLSRLGDRPDFGALHPSAPGAVRRPEPDVAERDLRDLPYDLIRVLDDAGVPQGPWSPHSPPQRFSAVSGRCC